MNKPVILRCANCGALLNSGSADCWLCEKPTGVAPVASMSPQGDRQDGRESYQRGLRAVLRDRTLSMDDLDQLAQVEEKYHLTAEDTKAARAQAFDGELAGYLVDAVLTDEEMEALRLLLASLALSPSDVPSAMSLIQRYYYLGHIQKGRVPILPPGQACLNTRTSEAVHLETPVYTLTTKSVSKGWAAGNSGFSFRIARGVYWRIGATRGHMLREQQTVTESMGTLSLTDQRIVYIADRKSFSFDWPKVLSIEPYQDGLTVHAQGRTTASTLLYKDPSQSELVAAICSHYLNL